MTDKNLAEPLSEVIGLAKNLPTLPTVALEILRLSRDEESSIDDFASAIALDPAITAKLLQLANSASFRRGAEVTSITRATTFLGINAVKLLALSFALTDSLPRKGATKTFDYLAYWQNSVITAVSSRELARLLNNKNPDEAFLCGLLGRIGQLVIADAMPEQYAEVLEQANGDLPSDTSEVNHLGFSHHQVGAFLLESWELPQMIHEIVASWGHSDEKLQDLDKATQDICRIIQMADAASQVIRSDEKDEPLKSLHRFGLQNFGLSEKEIDKFFVELEDKITEFAKLINVDLSGIADFGSILTDARTQMMEVSLKTALDLQKTASDSNDLKAENQKLSVLANTDKLTGIPNRASFDATFEKVIEARLKGPNDKQLGLLLMDVDRFKSINDTYGHALGDAVLKRVAQWIKTATRDNDFLARYGGEEFVVLVPNATPEILTMVAERIRKSVEANQVVYQDNKLSLTISVGGASLAKVTSPEDGAKLLKLADDCLYQAKEAGRNRTICR